MEIKNYELIILGILSFILSSLQINLFFNIFAMYILCFIISYKCYKNIKQSLKYAVFLTSVFYILKQVLNANNKYFNSIDKQTNINQENYIEHLKNEKQSNETDDTIDYEDDTLDYEKDNKDNIQDNEDDTQDYEEDNEEDNEEENIEQYSILENKDKNSLKSDEKKDLNDYLSELNNKDETFNDNTEVKDMSPAQAQRELYRLIDTTSLLKKTMSEMNPVINEGKKIMKSIEALKLIN